MSMMIRAAVFESMMMMFPRLRPGNLEHHQEEQDEEEEVVAEDVMAEFLEKYHSRHLVVCCKCG